MVIQVTSLWDDIAEPGPTNQHRQFTSARIELASLWPFLAGAETLPDFRTRLLLAEPRIRQAAGNDPRVMRSLVAAYEQDFRGLIQQRIRVERDQRLAFHVEAISMSRAHYEDLAEKISQLPDGEREKAANHIGHALVGTNPRFDRYKFENAATTPGYRSRPGTAYPRYSRGHYELLADAVKGYPGDQSGLARHLSEHFSRTQAGFNPERFLSRATPPTRPAQPKAASLAVRHTAPGGGEHGGYHLEEHGDGWFVVNHIGERKNKEAMGHDKALDYQRALMVNVPGAKASAEEHERKGEMPKESSLKTANKYIQQQGDKWVITQKGTGKVLSHHDSKEEAEAAFRGMEWAKHSRKTAAIEDLHRAVEEHARSERGTLLPGDHVGEHVVTNVGTHTVQFHHPSGWDTSIQIPFRDGRGNYYPSWHRALDEYEQSARVAALSRGSTHQAARGGDLRGHMIDHHLMNEVDYRSLPIERVKAEHTYVHTHPHPDKGYNTDHSVRDMTPAMEPERDEPIYRGHERSGPWGYGQAYGSRVVSTQHTAALDPTQMQPGDDVTVHYATSDGKSGTCDATFTGTDDQGNFTFDYDNGTFLAADDGSGQYSDPAGTSFTFSASDGGGDDDPDDDDQGDDQQQPDDGSGNTPPPKGDAQQVKQTTTVTDVPKKKQNPFAKGSKKRVAAIEGHEHVTNYPQHLLDVHKTPSEYIPGDNDEAHRQHDQEHEDWDGYAHADSNQRDWAYNPPPRNWNEWERGNPPQYVSKARPREAQREGVRPPLSPV